MLFDRGDEVVVQAGEQGIRFLLVSGKPIEEPVAWYGPIVMNTQAELQQAMAELQQRHLHQVKALSVSPETESAQLPDLAFLWVVERRAGPPAR